MIQSAGTPYMGTPLANEFAWLLNFLDPISPCGHIEDLTVEGAERWLSEIPSRCQKEVFYYTMEVSACMYSHFPCCSLLYIIMDKESFLCLYSIIMRIVIEVLE